MIYSVAQRDQFSRQGREYFATAAGAERALPQADPFPRSLALRCLFPLGPGEKSGLGAIPFT